MLHDQEKLPPEDLPATGDDAPGGQVPPEIRSLLAQQEEMARPLVEEVLRRKGGKLLTDEEVAQLERMGQIADEVMTRPQAYESMLKTIAQAPDKVRMMGQMTFAVTKEVITRMKEQERVPSISRGVLIPFGIYVLSRMMDSLNSAAGEKMVTEKDIALASMVHAKAMMDAGMIGSGGPDPEVLAVVPPSARRKLGEVVGQMTGMDKAMGRSV